MFKLPRPAHWTHSNWNTVLLVAVVVVLGTLLVALGLPVPPPQLPAASEVLDRDNHLVTTFYIQNRLPIRLSEVPSFLSQAFLATEDHRFYQHHGVNLGRILKAAIHDLTRGRLEQGGSTITQQLVKNAYLDQRRTLLRKIKELFYAIKLELSLSKDQILELYLNQIYFGHGAYGIKVAAQTYFGREMKQLNQAELALLAGLPKGPAYYSPYLHPEDAQRRIAQVLERMVECRYISRTAAKRFRSQPLRLAGLRAKPRPAPYFMLLLQEEIAKLFPKDPGILETGGLRIETTLDPRLQDQAERALGKGLPRLLEDEKGLSQPQGALIAVDPSNGEIRALVGGTDFDKSQFNRATQARRQPGSSFKPLLYAEALGRGYTLASKIDRSPKLYRDGSRRYFPTDDQNAAASGLLTLREALACSSNVVAVKLLEQLGIPAIIGFAKTLGIESRLPRHLSLALGTGEMTPLELTGAYLPLANSGYKIAPTAIRRILDPQGRVIYQAPTQFKKVVSPGIAYLITQAMTGVLRDGGTAANLQQLIRRPAAGKTGTTEQNRDAWFIGYTPDLLACVYVGCDRNERPLPGAANRVAAPIWADFMNQALAGAPLRDFVIPDQVAKVTICKETGLRATAFCPAATEYFLTGTEPTTYCDKHRFIRLQVCKRSGLLPSPYCKELEERDFRLGEQPSQTCELCPKHFSIFRWLRKFFRR
ncbi:penicillin-binding protein 1B [Hydrogenispora ethanolica]|uniref:Penicillin-binding protein 1B n=1 Tax=Hydrogenispora ethanolica TaxID=1082276 RepID=A0A4R1RZK3_HYDET|nr:PBP1A family penicillin-binding protein [Hydrogenispora ethanolica]TCL71680.1 penicillin-binding protein 1B [Hydrogenispora ethanolica]